MPHGRNMKETVSPCFISLPYTQSDPSHFCKLSSPIYFFFCLLIFCTLFFYLFKRFLSFFISLPFSSQHVIVCCAIALSAASSSAHFLVVAAIRCYTHGLAIRFFIGLSLSKMLRFSCQCGGQDHCSN